MARVSTLDRTLTRHVERQEERQRPLDFRLILRLLEFTRPYRSLRIFLMISVVLRSIQLPALTLCVASVINGPIAKHDVNGVVLGGIVFFLLALSTQVVMHFRQKLALDLGEAVVCDLRNALFRHLQTFRMRWFHETRVGRVISRMTSDIEDVRVGVQEVLFVTMVQVGQMGVAAIAMLWYDWQLFLLVLGLAPVLWLINHHFHRRLSKNLRNLRESFSRVTATLAESVVGIRVTQAFVRQQENSNIFEDLAEDHSRYNSALLKTQGLFLPLLDLNSQVFIVLLLLVGGYRVLQPDHPMDIGNLIGFFFMANLFFAPVLVIGNQYNQAMTAMAGAERLFNLLDTPPEWSDAIGAKPLTSVAGKVEVRDVTFGYNPSRPVLHNVSFQAEAGQMIALVGATGSGKSSIINLVAKFYLPQSGEILLDGIPLRDIQADSLHQHMGIVLQNNFLFYGTVADNIRFGKPGATDAEIREVLVRLGCPDLIDSLSNGLATQVGERGAILSSGQRQLICFARALIANPSILVLDEATSSIDSATEARLQAALSVLIEGRTSFVVAHRLSTIRDADLVLVLDHGHIVERGQHDDLIKQGGIYASLHQKFVQA
ncbi:ABC transporter ATP-binding protein [Planctomicrobium sp. SH668]|uniref:ABC transporter ATP-binding protein n=1 Tax=Planctomicrobium sp. SH668 TaxID=3448126 RepID=UPI003F5CAA5A